MQNKSNKEKHLHTFLSKMLSFLKYIKGKVLAGFNFIKKKCETLYDFLSGRVNVDIVRDAKILVFTLLLIVVGVESITSVSPEIVAKFLAEPLKLKFNNVCSLPS